MKIAAIVGARPNFVKIAPIVAALRAAPGFQPTLVHTGQHYDAAMSDSFFRDLDIPAPDVNLGVGSKAAALQIAEIMGQLTLQFTRDRPHLVLVVGDVNSTLAGALAAAKMDIPIAHVEAGLRSFDRTMPEEINRLVTDALADHCFTTEPSANDNLEHEGVAPERVHYVGNVMIDTLFRFREQAAVSPILEHLGLATGRYAILTMHRPGNVDDPAVLAQALRAIAPIAAEVPVVFPVHPRTRPRLTPVLDTAAVPGLRLVEPLAYLDFIRLMADARVVLTDSGGIQEETTALRVPCLTLRPCTERPVTVTHGTNRVVGLDAARVAAAWTEIQGGRWSAGQLPELWDGKAAMRIVDTLAQLQPE